MRRKRTTTAVGELRFDHAAIPVHDPGDAYELFAQTLQLPLVAAYEGDDWGGFPWLMMIFELADGAQLALCARAGAPPLPATGADLPHYALAANGAAQLRKWRTRLEAAGRLLREEDHGDHTSLYFEDRSGTTWEVSASADRSAPDPEATRIVSDWIAAHRCAQ